MRTGFQLDLMRPTSQLFTVVKSGHRLRLAKIGESQPGSELRGFVPLRSRFPPDPVSVEATGKWISWIAA